MKLRTPTRNGPRRGFVLILVLVVVVLLSLAAYTFSELMITEREATLVSGEQVQTRALVESGVDLVRLYLTQDYPTRSESGGHYDNPYQFQGVLVVDDPDPRWRGRFTATAPALDSYGLFDGVRYGLENESARINLNALMQGEGLDEETQRQLLMAMPGMMDDIADAILDWLDQDDEPRELGAELDYYATLDPPYEPRNGPLKTIDELLLVRGITPELLFGMDANHNGMVDMHERQASLEGTSAVGTSFDFFEFNGALDRGWSAYLTLHSSERNADSTGFPRVHVNGEDMELLFDELSAVMDADWATFIVAYRQNGPYEEGSEGQAGGGGGSGGGGGDAGGGPGGGRGGGRGGGDAGGGDAGGGPGGGRGGGRGGGDAGGGPGGGRGDGGRGDGGRGGGGRGGGGGPDRGGGGGRGGRGGGGAIQATRTTGLSAQPDFPIVDSNRPTSLFSESPGATALDGHLAWSTAGVWERSTLDRVNLLATGGPTPSFSPVPLLGPTLLAQAGDRGGGGGGGGGGRGGGRGGGGGGDAGRGGGGRGGGRGGDAGQGGGGRGGGGRGGDAGQGGGGRGDGRGGDAGPGGGGRDGVDPETRDFRRQLGEAVRAGEMTPQEARAKYRERFGGGGTSGGGGGGGGGGEPQRVPEPVDGRQVDLEQPGQTELEQVLDLIGKQVLVTFEGDEEPTLVESPFPEDPTAMADYLPVLMEYLSVTDEPVVEGRVNINQAPRAVLLAIPGLTEEITDQILALRGLPGTVDFSRSHPTWLLTEGIVTLDQMKSLLPYVTTRGDVFRAQVIGYYDGGGVSSRAEVIVDATTPLPRLLFWRELGYLGRGYTLDVLGTEANLQ